MKTKLKLRSKVIGRAVLISIDTVVWTCIRWAYNHIVAPKWFYNMNEWTKIGDLMPYRFNMFEIQFWYAMHVLYTNDFNNLLPIEVFFIITDRIEKCNYVSLLKLQESNCHGRFNKFIYFIIAWNMYQECVSYGASHIFYRFQLSRLVDSAANNNNQNSLSI